MVEVFKTDIKDPETASGLIKLVHSLLPGSQINFDLEDSDRILRVEADSVIIQEIENLLRSLGYKCEVLV